MEILPLGSSVFGAGRYSIDFQKRKGYTKEGGTELEKVARVCFDLRPAPQEGTYIRHAYQNPESR